MPAPRTDIDRDGIAARVALQGVRQTAKAVGLAPSTVMDIARARGVKMPEKPMRLTAVEPMRVHPHSLTSAQTSAQPSQKPAHAVITDEMQRMGADARLSAAIYTKHTLGWASEVARESPESALAMAGDVKSVVGAAQGANVPGFERQVEQIAGAVVNIALLGVDMSVMEQAVDVESELISTDPNDY